MGLGNRRALSEMTVLYEQPTVPYSASRLSAPNSLLPIRKQHTYLSEINIRTSEIYLPKTEI